MMSMDVAGGTLSPAKVGKGYGVKWTKQFAEGGDVKGKKTEKYAKGGSASQRADGCAQRGKTRGKII